MRNDRHASGHAEDACVLDPSAAAESVRHTAFDTIDSTNAEALRRAGEGERGPLWITAVRQTAGSIKAACRAASHVPYLLWVYDLLA